MIAATKLTESVGLTDEQVVAEVLAGRTALFELLMRRHNERLYRAARAIVVDDREAEDVVQQAYLNAYTHLRQFDGRARFSTWLTRIAVHEAIARARRKGRYIDLEADESGRVQQIMAHRSPRSSRCALVARAMLVERRSACRRLNAPTDVMPYCLRRSVLVSVETRVTITG